jgi:hypothetical protein
MTVTAASNNTVVTALNALTNYVKWHRSDYHHANVTPLTVGPLSIDANGIVTVALPIQVVRTTSPTTM